MKTTIIKQANLLDVISESNETKVHFHNLYCEIEKYYDDVIYQNDEEFFNTFFDNEVLKAVQAVCYGNYSYNHLYVTFNGYGNLDSSNYPEDFIDFPSLVESIEANPNDYDIMFEEDPNDDM